MNTVQRVICTCKHEQQDKMYGNQVRVANLCGKATVLGNSPAVRCTVCGALHKAK